MVPRSVWIALPVHIKTLLAHQHAYHVLLARLASTVVKLCVHCALLARSATCPALPLSARHVPLVQLNSFLDSPHVCPVLLVASLVHQDNQHASYVQLVQPVTLLVLKPVHPAHPVLSHLSPVKHHVQTALPVHIKTNQVNAHVHLAQSDQHPPHKHSTQHAHYAQLDQLNHYQDRLFV
jgi:hypothetical protein